jgi:hypothetical protein
MRKGYTYFYPARICLDFVKTVCYCLLNTYMAFRCQGKTIPIDRTTLLRISVFRKIV